MKKLILAGLTAGVALTAPAQTTNPPPAKLEIDLSQPGAKIGPLFYGLMTEEINHSYDGGLYAELIQNRSLKDDARTPVHWSAVSNGNPAKISLDQTAPINNALTTCLRLDTSDIFPGQRAGVANDGYWGIPVKPATTYRASFYAKGTSPGPLTVSIESNDGAETYAITETPRITSQWQRYEVTLRTGWNVKPAAAARFVISTESQGVYWFNLVSLFPPTFNQRPNGNRVDLMEKLGALKPAFLRCPGGNYLEGDSIGNRFQWEKTLGDIATRPGHWGPWGYRSSDGLGLLEFMEWAEDMHAEPVLAVWAGFALGNPSAPRGTSVPAGDALKPYVQEALDEIEYVTGGPETKWGAVRVRDGHPAPFPLHYVEIGNEDFIGDAHKTYEARFAQFYDAVKGAYPKLQCIATIPVSSRKPDVIDEHFYKTSDDMAALAHKYDQQDRNGPKVFVGEWATRELVQQHPDHTLISAWMPWAYKGAPTPDLHAALGDAAFMTGLERNADVVVMNCYAPLLVRTEPGALQWCPNLIGYDALTSYASPSYYAQQIFSQYRGDTVAKATVGGSYPALFVSATRTAAQNVVFLKVVNRGATPQACVIKLDGVVDVDPRAVATVLTSASPIDTNTITDPKKVAPKLTNLHNVKTSFSHTFPPFSITAIRFTTLNAPYTDSN